VTLHRARATPVRLDIAGDGPARAALEREATRLGVRDRITFHGHCSRAKVQGLLAGASMLAHPGANEAFGLAVLEARAAGVPVVAMASGGLPELVDHGRQGLLARTRSEFHDFIARMTLDAELRRRCASEAASNLEAYDWSRVVVHHEAAYAKAAAAHYTSGRHVKNSIAATI
jgi:glycosyltransferase involved in cell wall biosynthesis